eukprot:jgi/Botrbrau1/3524/Bobra.341_2s0051.1
MAQIDHIAKATTTNRGHCRRRSPIDRVYRYRCTRCSVMTNKSTMHHVSSVCWVNVYVIRVRHGIRSETRTGTPCGSQA